MKISIIGTGYVGLVSGLCLSSIGHDVVCVDINLKRVEAINNGDVPFYEPGLEDLLRLYNSNSFSATTDLNSAIFNSEVSIICVGTPFDGVDIDLQFVKQASYNIGSCLRSLDFFHTVVVKSTVIPSTTQNIVGKILEDTSGKQVGVDFGLCMNPEFLREGCAVTDFLHPDRIVLGTNDSRSLEVISRVYESFVDTTLISTSINTAEMIKYTSNSFFATLISFSNEITRISDSVGNIDSKAVFDTLYLDRRITSVQPDGSTISPDLTTYLSPGCGFGGSCFPKDVKALTSFAHNNSISPYLLESVLKVNSTQYKEVLKLLSLHFNTFDKLNCCVLGLSFKPGTDDVRESPSISIIESLLELNCLVKSFDPQAYFAPSSFSELYSQVDTLHEAVIHADAIIVATSWPEFQLLPSLLNSLCFHPLIVDCRRFFDPSAFNNYSAIGYGL